MDKLGWRAVWGLCLVQLSLAQIGECPPGRREGVARVARTDPTAAQAELALGTGVKGAVSGLDLVKEG